MAKSLPISVLPGVLRGLLTTSARHASLHSPGRIQSPPSIPRAQLNMERRNKIETSTSARTTKIIKLLIAARSERANVPLYPFNRPITIALDSHTRCAPHLPRSCPASTAATSDVTSEKPIPPGRCSTSPAVSPDPPPSRHSSDGCAPGNAPRETNSQHGFTTYRLSGERDRTCQNLHRDQLRPIFCHAAAF